MGINTDVLAGQVQALMTVAAAVIATHSDPALLVQHLASARLAAEARALPMGLSDEFQESLGETLEKLQAVAQKAAEMQGKQQPE